VLELISTRGEPPPLVEISSSTTSRRDFSQIICGGGGNIVSMNLKTAVEPYFAGVKMGVLL